MGAPRALALCRTFAGSVEFQGGNWNEAESSLLEAIRVYRELGNAAGEAYSIQRLGALWTAQGRLDDALHLMEEGLLAAERAVMRSHGVVTMLAAIVRNRLAASDLRAAEHNLREGERESSRHGHCVTCKVYLLVEAVRARLELGRIDEADVSASELEAIAHRFNSPAWIATARQARARVLARIGREDEADRLFEQARQSFLAMDTIYEAARCQLSRASLLRGRDAARAAALEAEARAVFTSLGAAGIES